MSGIRRERLISPVLTKSRLNDHLPYDAERIVDAYTGSTRLLSGLELLR